MTLADGTYPCPIASWTKKKTERTKISVFKMFNIKICKQDSENRSLSLLIILCDAMMHVLKDFINLKYSELLTEEISKSN